MSIKSTLTALFISLFIALFTTLSYGQPSGSKPILVKPNSVKKTTLQPKLLSVEQSFVAQKSILAWGGSGRAEFADIYADKNNNVYACGLLRENTRFNDTLLEKKGLIDGFLIKYNSTGKILWVRQLPGYNFPGYISNNIVKVSKVRTDNNGNVYILGNFQKHLTLPTLNVTSQGKDDLFLIKYDSEGNFIWCRTSNCPHASAYAFGTALGICSNGDVVVAGFFYNTINLGGSSFNATGNTDIFIGVFNSSGTFISLKKSDGLGIEECNDLAVDSKDNVYLTGRFVGGGLAFGNSIIDDSNPIGDPNYQDFFLAKYNVLDKSWVWALNEGVSNGEETGKSVCIDSEDNIYATGFCNGFGNIPYDQGRKAFIVKYNSNKSKIWEKTLNKPITTSGFSVGRGIYCDSKNNVCIMGEFHGKINLNNETSLDAIFTNGDQSDIFLVKYDKLGQLLNYRSFGATTFDLGVGLKYSNNGALYLVSENGFDLNFENPILYNNLPLQTPTIIKLTDF